MPPSKTKLTLTVPATDAEVRAYENKGFKVIQQGPDHETSLGPCGLYMCHCSIACAVSGKELVNQ